MDEKNLLRYIQGKSTRTEIHKVAKWLNESEENGEILATLKAKYVFSGFPNTVVRSKKNRTSRIVSVAAACFIPLLAASLYLLCDLMAVSSKYDSVSRELAILSEQNNGTVTYVARPGVISIVTLPDGSTVHLNGNTKLVAPVAFSTDCREVYLSGEGYFEVKHNEQWPMLVHTDKGLTAKVLGTTFDLSSYSDDDSLILTLVDGCVHMCEDSDGNEYKCSTGEEMILRDRKKADGEYSLNPVVRPADINLNTGWINGEFILKNTAMPEFIKKLERWHGVSVHVEDPEILKYHFTATFTSESISRVMEYISYSSMIDYDINGSDIYIRHSGSSI